jgi:hypothetical protein
MHPSPPQAFPPSTYKPEYPALHDNSSMPPSRGVLQSYHGQQPNPPLIPIQWMPIQQSADHGQQPNPPLTPIQWMPIQQSAGLLERRSAPPTPFPSHTVESQRPDNPNQMPLRLESHPRSRQPSRLPKGKSTDNDSAIGQDPSSVVLAQMARVMEVMDDLIDKIPSPYDYTKAAEEATNFIIADPSLSDEQRATLCIYYGKNIPEAADLASMEYPSRSSVFRKILGV